MITGKFNYVNVSTAENYSIFKNTTYKRTDQWGPNWLSVIALVAIRYLLARPPWGPHWPVRSVICNVIGGYLWAGPPAGPHWPVHSVTFHLIGGYTCGRGPSLASPFCNLCCDWLLYLWGRLSLASTSCNLCCDWLLYLWGRPPGGPHCLNHLWWGNTPGRSPPAAGLQLNQDIQWYRDSFRI